MFKSLLMAGALFAAAMTASASVITASVPLTSADGGYQYSGLGFIATVDSTLVSFTFENQGQADSVLLVDASGNIIDSVSTPAATTTYTATVNWSLAAGTQYYLLQSTDSNALYGVYGSTAPSNAELQLTDTGVFSVSSLLPSNFAIGGTGGGAFAATNFWSSFSEVVTAADTPEPGTFLLAGLPLVLILRAKAKQRR